MALATYADLQSSILSWLGRPGDSIIPTADLITLFEADANRRLRTHFQETSATITTVGGTDTYALPSTLLAPREVKITSTNPIRELNYLSPSQIDDLWVFSTNQEPINYTLEGSNIRFGPIPDSAYTVTVGFFQTITTLSGGVNWLYQHYPDIYLFGSLAEAELFLGADSSDDRYQMFLQRRENAYQAINLADRKYRTGGTPLRMQLDVGNP